LLNLTTAFVTSDGSKTATLLGALQFVFLQREYNFSATRNTTSGAGMAESVLDQILVDLRESIHKYFPERGELRNLRVVGHTPRNDHFVYDASADFAEGSERIAIKVYRANKCGGNAKGLATQENGNLQYVHQPQIKKKLVGVPRPLGDYSELGAVVTEKIAACPCNPSS
jgi:hypothetical protein